MSAQAGPFEGTISSHPRPDVPRCGGAVAALAEPSRRRRAIGIRKPAFQRGGDVVLA